MKARSAGLSAWLVQRISAVYMLLFIVFLLVSLWLAPFSSYAEWKSWVARPAMTLALALFFVALLSHMWVGLRDVLLDYARPASLRQFLLVLVAAGLCGVAVWVAWILVRTHS